MEKLANHLNLTVGDFQISKILLSEPNSFVISKNSKKLIVIGEFVKRKTQPKFRFSLLCSYRKEKYFPSFELSIENLYGEKIFKPFFGRMPENIFELCKTIKEFVSPKSAHQIDNVLS